MKKKSVGVFGLGVSGIATCEALAASGASVYSWDENAKAREKTKDTEYLAEHPKEWPWKDLAALIVSPGVPLHHPKPHTIVRKAQIEKVEVIGDVELFARAVNAMPERERPRIAAVTGSNGKSTTTALIGHMLQEAGEEAYLGGNIGEAILSLPEPDARVIYVLELSSFQLDLTHSLRANAAAFLNLTPDHLDRHGTVDAYFEAKKRIFRNQTPDDLAIVSVDDVYGERLCTEMTARGAVKMAPISARATLGRGVYALKDSIYLNFDGKASKAGELGDAQGLRGPHNRQNAVAALAVATHLGVSPAIAMKAARSFRSLPHRLEEVGRAGKVVFVNDSKATNADAAARALAAFDDVYWIAGGKAKDGGLSALTGRLHNVRKAYFIGDAANAFSEQVGDEIAHDVCNDLSRAVSAALRDAAASDAPAPVVLLSPACASYDQFRNFEERGDRFRALVNDLLAENGEAA
ncbi:MAG: UDP-N-acetylmuramoyl-L-alanine--D-glutamate ligase [Pseudomonadota bacterium]